MLMAQLFRRRGWHLHADCWLSFGTSEIQIGFHKWPAVETAFPNQPGLLTELTARVHQLAEQRKNSAFSDIQMQVTADRPLAVWGPATQAERQALGNSKPLAFPLDLLYDKTVGLSLAS